jgi:hypothetical protein
MVVQFETLPGSEDRANEDFVGAFPDCAVLLDGAGGPSELPNGCIHGTAWYVRQLGARCLAGMEISEDRPLAEILAERLDAQMLDTMQNHTQAARAHALRPAPECQCPDLP